MKIILSVFSLLFIASCSHNPKKEQNLTLTDAVIELEAPPVSTPSPKITTPTQKTKNKLKKKETANLPVEVIPVTPTSPLPHSWQNGEKFVYKIYILGLEAGSLILKTSSDTFKNLPVWKFSGHLYSSGFAGSFYDINATATSLIDLSQLFSYRFSLVSDEGKKHKERLEIFSPALKKSSFYEKITEENEPDKIKKGAMDAAPSQDILSILYALRNLNPNLKNQKISVISIDEVVQADVQFSQNVSLKTLQGVKDCLLLLVTLPRSSEKTTAKIWMSNDDSRIIYKIEAPTKIGSATMELKELTIP